MKFIVSAFLLILITACNNSVSRTDFDKGRIAEEVKQMLHDYHLAIEKGGLAAEFDYLDNSDDFFWVPPGYNSALKYDSVKTILLQNDRSLKAAVFQWEKLEVYPLSNRITTFSGIIDAKITDTAEVQTATRILESGTLIRREDGWKLLSGQSVVLASETLQ